MSKLDDLCKEMNKKAKENIAQFGIKDYTHTVIPLSSPRANYSLYGGIPTGRIIEFFGEEGGGKTTTALDACVNAQKLFEEENPDNPKRIVFLDAENTYDPKWGELLGVDSSNIMFIKPMAQSAEELFDWILECIETGEVGLVVIDSLGVLVSQQAMEKKVEDRTYGGISMALTAFSKKAEMLCHRHNCTIIGINQVRDNLNSPYGGTTTTGGRAWRHNCFSGNVRFLTDRGYRRFRDCVDGEVVTVVDKDGEFRQATVHKYGKQKMQRVFLRTPQMVEDIICTPDHSWILKDGSTTTSLKVGDHLYIRNENTPSFPATQRQKEMFCLGMVIADGCDHRYKGTTSAKIVLYGEKAKYGKVFEDAGYRSWTEGGDPCYKKTHISKQGFLSGEGWKYLSAEDKRFLFLGYYCGDGHKDGHTCTTSDPRVLNFIKETSGMAGYYITSISEECHGDDSFKPGATYYKVFFTVKQTKENHWTVYDIHSDRERECWCVEEPVTHSFTLEKGIVTGNCSLRVQFRRGDFFDENGAKVNSSFENPAGNLVQMSVVKSKCFPNDRKTGFYSLHYYKGILATEDTVDLAVKEGIIVQAGAWFSLLDNSTGELIEKFQGKKKLVDYLNENPDKLEELKCSL